MATAYSEEVAIGSYNRIRLRVEHSGTSASCYIEFRRTSTWTDTWGDDAASITFNGQTVAAPYWYTGTVDGNWRTIDSAAGFTVPIAGGTFSWHFNNPLTGSVLDCGGTITIASQATPPTGLSISNIVAGTDSFTADVSVTGWGTGGSTANSYSELSVCTGQSAAQRKWQIASGRNNTVTITVDNNAPHSTGNAFTITPNTTYYLTMYATNGDAGTGNSVFTQVTTLPASSVKMYGSVNDQAKQIKKMYGSVNGARKKIVKIYGSVNGSAKLIYEDNS